MNVRNLKMNDAFEKHGNRYVIEKGLRKLQLTETELLDLRKQLNEFVLHNVSVNEERVAFCNCGVTTGSWVCGKCKKPLPHTAQLLQNER